MLTANTLIIVIGLIVLAVGTGMAVFFRRREQSQLPSSQDDVQPFEQSLPKTDIGPAEATDTPPISLKPSTITRSASSVSWENQSLFSSDSLKVDPYDENLLPTIEQDEIPNIDTSDYVFGSATQLFAELLPESPERRKQTKQELKNAGYYQPHAQQNLAAIRYLMIMLPLLFFGFLLLFVPSQMELPVIGFLVLVPLLGWALPRLYVSNKGRERQFAIERGMPDLLDMLNMCVSQGLTVQNALRRVTPDLKSVYPDLAKELSIVNDQTEVGSLKLALENFSKRIDVPEVHSFTSLINQTERMGTSVSDALTEYSDTMRESLRQRADQQANQASFKLLFPTVLCLMPAVYIFLLSPAIIEVTRFFNDGGFDALDRGQQAIEELNR